VPDFDVVAAVADKQAITEVCYRYGIALDARDWGALRSCFTHDAIGHYGGPEVRAGYEQIEAMCRDALAPLSASQHLIGNVLVELHGDEAESVCYLQAQHVRPATDGGDQFIFAGRYTDHFVRTPDGWRIAIRRLDPMWTAGNAAVLS
jgi:ketosteroid isomerase-like protein